MIPDLSPIFDEYVKLRDSADGLFAHISQNYPTCVTCKEGCSDCCHALFDLSLVEAMYINKVFTDTFKYGPERSRILEKASDLDRDLTRLKRQMFRAEKNGEKAEKIMDIAATTRMPCPLLTEGNICALYEARPITCRLYGIPLDIGGKSHVCGFSSFDKGDNYPAVRLGKIQQRLEELSKEIANTVQSRFDLSDVYVPLSMALLTRYDDAYLGIGQEKEEK